MGDIKNDTHRNRSSSMSYALRLGHEHGRHILILSLISIAMILVFWVLMYGTNMKQIKLVNGSEEEAIITNAKSVQALLDEQGIALRPFDVISKAAHMQLRNGDRLEIDYAKPVLLTVGGQTEKLYTTASTVGALLQDLRLQLNPQDQIWPSVDEEVAGQMQIKVVKVHTQVEKLEQPIPFQTVKTEDPTMLKGSEKVVQQGQEGRLVKDIEKTFEDGLLKKERVVSELIASDSVNKVIAVGTKVPQEVSPVTVLSNNSPVVDTVMKDGVNFDAKEVLHNVTLTAYSAGVASTGKDENHPQYGITASGAKVSEGRTVAVDPNVIPLGWWIYIDGIGLRRAEDTGGAVKGKKIDVYFDNEAHVNKFGLKRGYTVYVIGPTKPSVN